MQLPLLLLIVDSTVEDDNSSSSWSVAEATAVVVGDNEDENTVGEFVG